MPELGDIKSGRTLGYKSKNNLIYVACRKCGREHWVKWYQHLKPNHSGLCFLCAVSKKGSESSAWKGGRTRRKDKYIMVKLMPDDFYYSMSRHDGYVLEHRLVMAKHLGRLLQIWEDVHHINHIRDDNRLENLQLCSEVGHNQLTRIEQKIERQSELIKELRQEIRLLRWQQIKDEIKL